MKKYFYSNGQGKEGPVTLEELKQKDITPKTLIWHEGLDDWKEAESVDELKELFELSPPPIDTKNDTTDLVQSEDLGSENSSETTNGYSVKKQRMFSNPFSFCGRIRRTEYGISFIIYALIYVIVEALFATGDYPNVGLAYFPLSWFYLAQGAKRCHDLGKNGWWQLIPFYPIWLIFAGGYNEINQYGRNPKG